MGGRVRFSIDLLLACLLLASLFMVINGDEAHQGEVEDEHPFNYMNNDAKGPEHWGEINPEWQTCDNGKLQSPIDLLNERVDVLPTMGQLRRTYKPAPAVIKSRGHDIQVKWEGDAGSVFINGTEYKLLQCHWHTPSEHTIEGKQFKAELHMVHENKEGKLAVIGILYKLGRPDTFLNKFLGYMGNLTEEERDVGEVNPREIQFGSRKYYRYLGSLTVPPCTEGVTWTVLQKVRTVSIEQIRALKQAVEDGFEENARPTQTQDGRRIYFYRPNLANIP